MNSHQRRRRLYLAHYHSDGFLGTSVELTPEPKDAKLTPAGREVRGRNLFNRVGTHLSSINGGRLTPIPPAASRKTPDPDTLPTSPDAPASALHASSQPCARPFPTPDYSPYAKHRFGAALVPRIHTGPTPALPP